MIKKPMDFMCKVSVIVPVYKAEAYLYRCLDSIMAQTMTDWECILVDDGSPDRSGEICDEYAQQDPRIRVIHKENGGVGLARQTGLEAARGEYVIHADPDDWVEPNMLEELYAKAKEESADMVICDYYENSQGVDKYISQRPRSLLHNDLISELFHGTLHGSCWNKLIKRKRLQENNIQFPSLSLCEDTFFLVSLLLHPIKTDYQDKAYYHYVKDNINSVTNLSNRKQGLNAYRYCVEMRNLLSNHSEYWEVFVKVCMGNWAYLSLYYGSVGAEEYKRVYGDLLDVTSHSFNSKMATYALGHYRLARIYMICRRVYGKLRMSSKRRLTF